MKTNKDMKKDIEEIMETIESLMNLKTILDGKESLESILKDGLNDDNVESALKMVAKVNFANYKETPNNYFKLLDEMYNDGGGITSLVYATSYLEIIKDRDFTIDTVTHICNKHIDTLNKGL